MQKTIVIIWGGESFSWPELYIDYLNNYRIEPWREKKKWKNSLASKALMQWWDVFMPQMPCSDNAHYSEWLIVFKRLLHNISCLEDTVFIGHSLGGCFLLRAISELNIKCSQLHTIAACVHVWDFTPPDDWRHLQSLWDHLHIWHSEDDYIVPFADAQFLSAHLPNAITHFYNDVSHFHKLEEFSDLEQQIGIK